jgi:hypothetical protein
VTSLAAPEYLITIALLGAYFILRANLFPALSNRLPARNFLVLVFCGIVLLNVYVYRQTVADPSVVDRTTLQENALRKLNAMLPDVPRIGYITDIPRSSRNKWLELYVLTRYVVAPRLVEEGSGPEWVVVLTAGIQSVPVRDDLALVKDFGDGVMLFRRKSQ